MARADRRLAWDRSVVDGALVVPEVDADLRVLGETLLARARAAIAQRDRRGFVAGVAGSSFCARAQVSALMEFALSEGEVLAHHTVFNGRPVAAPPDRQWRLRDWLFDAASIAFVLGGRGRATTAVRLCPNTLLRRSAHQIQLLHRCDLARWSLPAAYLPVLLELARGFDRAEDLAERLPNVDGAELTPFLRQVEREGLLHAREPASHRPAASGVDRAARVIALAHREVPLYARLPSDRLSDAQFLFSEAIRADWQGLFARRASARRARLHVRRSSASMGAPLVTVLEERVREERALHDPVAVRRPRRGVIA